MNLEVEEGSVFGKDPLPLLPSSHLQNDQDSSFSSSSFTIPLSTNSNHKSIKPMKSSLKSTSSSTTQKQHEGEEEDNNQKKNKKNNRRLDSSSATSSSSSDTSDSMFNSFKHWIDSSIFRLNEESQALFLSQHPPSSFLGFVCVV